MAARQLIAWSNDRRVGTLAESDDLWRFDYDPGWTAAADGFDLSPALDRATGLHVDGATHRPVQWYFDNLLPEEAMRTLLASEAQVPSEDAFGLLAYFGAESAGSLLLLPPGSEPIYDEGLVKLEFAELSRRIRNLPAATLNRDAPTRMSLAGAQHKMVVVLREGALFEPLPGRPSTHILKPDHPGADYTATVANEWFCMRLAAASGIRVPRVRRLYVPEPVYLVERFDRASDPESGRILRRHIVDSCQLLDKARSFKYASATLEVLVEAIARCRSRAAARLQLYRWLIFNLLIGNNDNHLKNLSFIAGPEGLDLAPAYDLLCTLVYSTRAFADDRATWPNESLTIALGETRTPGAATHGDLIAAGSALGLARDTCARELDRMLRRLPEAAQALLADTEADNEALIAASPDPAISRARAAGDLRVLRAIVVIVIADTVRQVLATRTDTR